VGDMMMMVTDW